MQSFGSGRCDIASHIFCITGDVWYSLVCLSGQGIKLIQITCFSVQILDILYDLAQWNLFLRLPLEPQNLFVICKKNYTQPLKKNATNISWFCTFFSNIVFFIDFFESHIQVGYLCGKFCLYFDCEKIQGEMFCARAGHKENTSNFLRETTSYSIYIL